MEQNAFFTRIGYFISGLIIGNSGTKPNLCFMIGFVISIPLSIWALNNWLQSFACRINISWLTITGACLISLVIAFMTVGYKSLKALETPVKSLRSE